MPVKEQLIDVGRYRLRAVEQGEGPLVLMIHGFPGLAWSWRHQMAPLAEAGYRAVAIDSLGYGGSDRPADPAAYTSDHMQDYLIALLDHYGAAQAVIVGQDFGAQYAWNLAVRAPERVAGLVATIPYDYDMAGRAMLGSGPRYPADAPARPEGSSPDRLPSERFAAMAQEHFVHLHYFQQVGPAERELAARPREFLARLLYALSSEGDLWSWKTASSVGSGYLDVLPPAPPLPWPWLSEAEFDRFVAEYVGAEPMLRFIGGLNSYRTADANWRIGERWADHDVGTPTLFLYGAKDPAFGFFPDWEERMPSRVPGLRGMIAVPGAGHFVQQEQPEAFNRALIAFADTVTR
ncbi:alpha/beta fold hydrolase [Sphingobium sp. EP60837]|uniref:alpha/beta fold hydrolase n=1 Tax=Sphingobium sp. EP60837 TaxID=1855519 RepID=UPI0007DD6D53|nr:alpha/beta hydrolase [Sphingobium sp. EP60837]ANI79735.1 Haloalkane dehalogenase [Sphingobium sp. EP60837]